MSQLVCHYCGHHDPTATLGVRCPADGSVLVPAPEHEKAPEDSLLGRVVGGKYAIIGLIGQGAMGAVYKAMQEPVGREVALKVIRNQRGEQAEELRSRFLREARVAAKLSNPSAVTLFDYGAEKDGVLYMVMELVRGRTMGAALAEEGPFAPERIVPIAVQVLHALSEAHGVGLVHRDIKPDNIMLVKGPWGGELAKVLDFGIAKILEAGDDAVFQTRAGLVLGTPLYMAPEQATARELDGRSDLYSVGVMLFQMLTGTLPFTGATPFDVLLAHRDQPIPPFPDSPPVPDALQDVIFQALQKNPADRFPDAGAMAQALLAAVPNVQLPPQQLAGAASARIAGLSPAGQASASIDLGEAPTCASSRLPAAAARSQSQARPAALAASPAAAAAADAAAHAPTPVPPAPAPEVAEAADAAHAPTPVPPAPAAEAPAAQLQPGFVPFSAGKPQPAAFPDAPVPATTRTSRLPLVLGLIAAVLLLAGAGGYFAWRNLHRSPAVEPPDAPIVDVSGPPAAAKPAADEGGQQAAGGTAAAAPVADAPAVPAADSAQGAAAAAPVADVPVPAVPEVGTPQDTAAAAAAEAQPAEDPPAAQPERLLFEDDFARDNSAAIGAGFLEFSLRADKAGKRSLRIGNGDWVIRNKALSIWTQAFTGSAVEDFAVTAEAFAVEGSRVEFSLRGVLPGSDAALYALWVEDPHALTAGPLSAGTLGGVVSADKGKPFASLVSGGSVLAEPPSIAAPLDPKAPVRCVLSVDQGKVSLQVGDGEPISATLAQPLAAGERRKLLIGIRATTKVWHKIDVAGLKVYGR